MGKQFGEQGRDIYGNKKASQTPPTQKNSAQPAKVV